MFTDRGNKVEEGEGGCVMQRDGIDGIMPMEWKREPEENG